MRPHVAPRLRRPLNRRPLNRIPLLRIPQLLAPLLLGLLLAAPASAGTAELTAAQAAERAGLVYPVGEVLASRRIEADWGGHAAWSLTFADATEALVDAESGDLLYFSRLPTAATGAGDLTLPVAEARAAALLGQLFPDRQGDLVPSPVRPPEQTDGSISLTFTRSVGGVLYPLNGARVTLFRDGSIGGFQSAWSDLAMPAAPAPHLAEREALRRALDLVTADPKAYLIYHHINGPDQPPDLAYLVRTRGADLLLNARTGAPLDPGSTPVAQPSLWRRIQGYTAPAAVWAASAALAFWIGWERSRRRHTLQTMIAREVG